MPIDPTPFLKSDPLIAHVPLDNLAAWHAANKADTTSGLVLPDLSKSGHDIAAASNAPAVQANQINSFPAVYFDGTKTPLSSSDTIAARHIFIVAKLDEAAFTAARGLLTGTAANPILVGTNGDTKFASQSFATGYEYRRSYVEFTQANQQAPISTQGFKIIEIVLPANLSLAGFQYGQDRADTAKRWKGWFAEGLIYSGVLNTLQRQWVYEYLASKYQLWQYVAEGYPIFPYPSNGSRSMERDHEHYLSEPYQGQPVALIRAQKRRSFSLPFAIRSEAEFAAADAFHAQNYPDPSKYFIYRDWRYYPSKYFVAQVNSPFREQGSDVSYRFNYSFDIREPDFDVAFTPPKDVFIDTASPLVSITAPINGAKVSGTVNITGTVSDNASVSQVEIFINNVSIGLAAINSGTWSKSWDVSGAAYSSPSIKAVATDSSGNSADSPAISIEKYNSISPVFGSSDSNYQVNSDESLTWLSGSFVEYPFSKIFTSDGDVLEVDIPNANARFILGNWTNNSGILVSDTYVYSNGAGVTPLNSGSAPTGKLVLRRVGNRFKVDWKTVDGNWHSYTCTSDITTNTLRYAASASNTLPRPKEPVFRALAGSAYLEANRRLTANAADGSSESRYAQELSNIGDYVEIKVDTSMKYINLKVFQSTIYGGMLTLFIGGLLNLRDYISNGTFTTPASPSLVVGDILKIEVIDAGAGVKKIRTSLNGNALFVGVEPLATNGKWRVGVIVGTLNTASDATQTPEVGIVTQ